MAIEIKGFFDPTTHTISYVVSDPQTKDCAVIDPVWDYNPESGALSYTSADNIIAFIKARGLRPVLILETHAHADHLSAAQHIKAAVGGRIGIGRHITDTQRIFAARFNLRDMPTDGSQFDVLLDEGATFKIGGITGHVMHTPGHTPACVSYLIEDAVFVGDTLFMPDYGTARADFPGGDARMLYRSIKRLLALPSQTRMFLCHDYKGPGREDVAWETTVAAQCRDNVHIHDGVTEDAFVSMRTEKDKTLAVPRLLLPSIQVNIRAGQLPPPENNGLSYLKIPLTVK
jgi:glyoxylase-like metal-dependent hydrolase (beta-lactamase superfamily II)